MSQHDIALTVNGARPPRRAPRRASTLVDFLRDELRLTGTHVGCEHGVCGACSVLLDGKPVRSCLVFAVQADGAEIVTVEGLAPDAEGLSVLQDSFWEMHALQCGYCTPGMLIAAHALLRDNPAPSEHGDPRRDRRQSLPLHRLQADRRRDRAGGRAAQRRRTCRRRAIDGG